VAKNENAPKNVVLMVKSMGLFLVIHEAYIYKHVFISLSLVFFPHF